MRHLAQLKHKALRGRMPSGLVVSFKTKMRGLPAALSGAIYVRASAKTVHHDGAIVTLDTGEFGTTYDDTAGYYGFETEPAATNLSLNSAGAAATYTTSNVSDAGTPITGFAQSLAFGNNSVQRSATKPISVTSGTPYTISFYIQMDDGGAPVIGSTNTTGDFSFTLNGVIGTTNPLVRKIGDTGTLYRVSAARTASATTSHEAGITKFTGQSARTFRVVGIQVETGVRATSYIETAGSTATRAADPLVQPLSAINKFNIAGYTLFVSCRRDVVLGTNLYAMSFTSGTTANRVGMSVNASNVEGWVVDSGGVSQVNITGASPGTSVRKRAVSLSTDNFISGLNGADGASDNTMTMPVVFTVLGIGNQNGAAFNGFIYEAALYNSAYSQANTTGLTV